MIYSQMSFPSNVYACALKQAFSSVDFTGYGIDIPGESEGVPAAQRRVAEIILARLPEEPVRILEVGCGLGTLALLMTGRGHQVTALTPDLIEADILQARCVKEGGGPAVYRRSLQAYIARGGDWESADKPRFDVIVLQNSAQYLEPLLLFPAAARLLSADGRLLICDEFIGDDSRIQRCTIPVLQIFLRMAERIGFSLKEQLNLDHEAASCVRKFLPALADFQEELARICSVETASVRKLQDELAGTAEALEQGRHTYALLDLRRSDQSRQADNAEHFGDISSFAPADIAPLFERSFDVPFDQHIWHWKYGDGRGRAVCISLEGTPVAHYGGAPRNILYFGAPCKAIQICDVMVMPEKRGFYSRDGLFFRAAATFLEQYVGNSAEHLLGVGFPNIKAMHVAERLGLYEKTDDFVEVIYSTKPEPDTGWQVGILDPEEQGMRARIDALWQTMKEGYTDAIIGIRDWDYLRYRFFEYPQPRFHALQCITPGGELMGVLIWRRHGEGTLIMDILAASQHLSQVAEAGSAFLRHKDGQPGQVSCWITRAFAPMLMSAGSSIRDLQIEIPCNRWSNGPATSVLAGKWWLTAGDMDFM
jgi:SAM-dependent methyltransferase